MWTLPKTTKGLICITGKMGSGKTTAINYLEELGYKTFKMDDYIKEIYQNGQIGYKLIKENFGSDFINNISVDRKKLRDFIFENKVNKDKLDKVMLPIMLQKLIDLDKISKKNKEVIFVELGIYIFFEKYFEKYFSKKIGVVKKSNFFSINLFENDSKYIEFSTKPVGNSQSTNKTIYIYVDYLVDNIGELENFKKNIKNLLQFL